MTRNPDVYLWEKIRPLDPLPEPYTERYSNAQAAIGLRALDKLDEWTAGSQAHARILDAELAEVPGVETPYVPAGYEHVYYQYCVKVPDRWDVVRHAIRRGVDVESLHVDVCPRLDMLGGLTEDDVASRFPGTTRAAEAVQLPVYQSLLDEEVRRVGRTLRLAVTGNPTASSLAASRA
jgi:dTDP-4-amino-4,6-dideoxygalactose transaminase